MPQPTRRDILKWSALLAGAALFVDQSVASDTAPKQILFFTKSSGYQHSVINRRGRDEPAYAEKILIELGKKNNMEVTASKDGRVFTPDGLAKFDAIVFMTTGDLTQPGTDKEPPMPATGKQALIDAVAAGKGFAGIHCAADTFHSVGNKIDPYIALLGGEFVTHGIQQKSVCHVVDTRFPGVSRKDFGFVEEWYVLNNFAPDLHVILEQKTAGMTGPKYQLAPYPSTWARAHGKGRVFYTSMGHREEVWTNSLFTNLLMGGISWTARMRDADVAPNLSKL